MRKRRLDKILEMPEEIYSNTPKLTNMIIPIVLGLLILGLLVFGYRRKSKEKDEY